MTGNRVRDDRLVRKNTRAVSAPTDTAGSGRRLDLTGGKTLGHEISMETQWDRAFPRVENRGKRSRATEPTDAANGAPIPDLSAPPIRIDKWLWHARFFKTRGLATRICASGTLRVDGDPIAKAHFQVRPGMVLTFPQGSHVRVVRVRDIGARRGSAMQARGLYEDLAPPPARPHTPSRPAAGQHGHGGSRPTKADRRALDRLRSTSRV